MLRYCRLRVLPAGVCHRAENVGPSAKVGVALAKDTSVSPSDLLTRADTAAYRAKERGRNRYEEYREAE